MQMAARKPIHRSRWYMPAFSVLLGLLMLGAFALGGDVGGGLAALGVMVALAAGTLVFGRSETVRGLSGPGRDERWAKIDVTATAITGSVLIAVIIGAFLVEVARGEGRRAVVAARRARRDRLHRVRGAAALALVVLPDDGASSAGRAMDRACGRRRMTPRPGGSSHRIKPVQGASHGLSLIHI